MKTYFRNSSITNQRHIFTALVLSSILSVSSSISLIDGATAAPINNSIPEAKATVKVSASNLPLSVRNAIFSDLSRRQGILPSKISIVESSKRTWNNGCLELAQPGELCTQALVPGWQVIASDGRNNFVYHTNNNGRILRLANRTNPDNGTSVSLPTRVRNAVVTTAAYRLRVKTSQIRIIQSERRDWKDGCLEIAEPNRVCSQSIVPGWRVVVVGIKDQTLVYHTNESGSVVRLNQAASEISNTPSQNLSSRARRAVLNAAAQYTGLSTSELKIVDSEEITVDGCLSLPNIGEACTKIAQRAWKVTVEAAKRRLVYHVKPDGSQVRLNSAASNSKLPQAVSNKILQRTSRSTGIPISKLSVIGFDSGKWQTSRYCPPGQDCPSSVSSYIWKVTVGDEKDRWVYLSNENGNSLQLLVEGLPKAVTNAVLSQAAETAELPQKAFDVVSYKRKQWFFGCDDPATRPVCTPIPVSGWEVSVLPYNSRDAWVYDVSENGSQLKLVQGGKQNQTSSVNVPRNIADAVLRDASQWSGRSQNTFKITKAQKTTFPNPCGLTFNPICDRSYRPTPGWTVTVDSGLSPWTYLVSADAKIVNQDQTPALLQRLAEILKRDALKRSGEKELAKLRITDIKLLSNSVHKNFDTQVTISNGMQNWVYAVNKDSNRFEYLPVASIPKPILDSVLADAQKRAVAKVTVSRQNITGAEQVTWKNGNLGLGNSVSSSSAVKGWRITVVVGRERFVYHTNNFVGNTSNQVAVRLNPDASRITNDVSSVPIPTSELPPPLTYGVVFRYVTTGGIAGGTYETVLLEDGRIIQTRLGDTNDSERRVFKLSGNQTKQFKELLKQQAQQFQNISYPAKVGAADYITYTLTTEDGTLQYNDTSRQDLPDNLKVVLKTWNNLTVTLLSGR
ncbi:MAG: hypothetical protein IGS39_20560 [Calothrix sp. C42_A2020_038]|nr:hypothetical protein [Calothrix sp. C42_A2020_038]